MYETNDSARRTRDKAVCSIRYRASFFEYECNAKEEKRREENAFYDDLSDYLCIRCMHACMYVRTNDHQRSTLLTDSHTYPLRFLPFFHPNDTAPHHPPQFPPSLCLSFSRHETSQPFHSNQFTCRTPGIDPTNSSMTVLACGLQRDIGTEPR